MESCVAPPPTPETSAVNTSLDLQIDQLRRQVEAQAQGNEMLTQQVTRLSGLVTQLGQKLASIAPPPPTTSLSTPVPPLPTTSLSSSSPGTSFTSVTDWSSNGTFSLSPSTLLQSSNSTFIPESLSPHSLPPRAAAPRSSPPRAAPPRLLPPARAAPHRLLPPARAAPPRLLPPARAAPQLGSLHMHRSGQGTLNGRSHLKRDLGLARLSGRCWRVICPR